MRRVRRAHKQNLLIAASQRLLAAVDGEKMQGLRLCFAGGHPGVGRMLLSPQACGPKDVEAECTPGSAGEAKRQPVEAPAGDVPSAGGVPRGAMAGPEAQHPHPRHHRFHRREKREEREKRFRQQLLQLQQQLQRLQKQLDQLRAGESTPASCGPQSPRAALLGRSKPTAKKAAPLMAKALRDYKRIKHTM